MQLQMDFLDSPSGKTYREPLAAMEERTSALSCNPSAILERDAGQNAITEEIARTRDVMGWQEKKEKATKKNTLLFLDLRRRGGILLGVSWEKVSALPGVCMTLNFGEYPSVARESTLSQILQMNAPEKYCLSTRACQGIINRAAKRGKELPAMLMDALLEVVNGEAE